MNMRSTQQSILTIVMVLAFALSACGGGQASNPADTSGDSGASSEGGEAVMSSATLDEIEGEVTITQSGESQGEPAKLGDMLYVGGKVVTGLTGKARLVFEDGTIVRLVPNTEFVFSGMDEEQGEQVTKVQLLIGNIFVILAGGSLDVDTDSGVASVRGSYMEVRIDPETGTITITCLEGTCSAQTNDGEASVVAGQTITLTSEDLPPEIGDMSEEDIRNWLENNPEATVVVVPLTATVAALASNTPTPAATATATTTPVSPTPTQPNPMLTLSKDALCFTGPGGAYVTVGAVYSGQTANIVGQNGGFWIIELPGKPGVLCWVAKGSGTATGSASTVPGIPAPPTPTPVPTATPMPDLGPSGTCAPFWFYSYHTYSSSYSYSSGGEYCDGTWSYNQIVCPPFYYPKFFSSEGNMWDCWYQGQ
jgi:hypothetical protein